MKIALLAHNLHCSGGLSVGRAIVSTLPRIAPTHRYLISVPADRGYDDALNGFSNAEVWRLPVGSYWSRWQFERRLAKRAKEWKCDWAWILGNNLFSRPDVPYSLLVQNSYYLNYPLKKLGIAPKNSLRAAIERALVARCVKKSRRVYGQTETVCRRLVETFGVPRPRVALCPMGSVFDAIAQDDAIPEAARIEERNADKFRLIYAAAPYPHKNHRRVVETFAKYRDELRDVACFFTFSPEQSAETRALARRVRETGLSENIVFVGTVPHSQMAACYRAADAALYPSLLETVGLGVLEGMSFGLPTIASDLDFEREICGDAALLIDPTSLERIRDGILALKNDPALRENFRAAGLERVETTQQTWEEILKQVLDGEGVPY